jgi:hypothetical protein
MNNLTGNYEFHAITLSKVSPSEAQIDTKKFHRHCFYAPDYKSPKYNLVVKHSANK